MADLQIGDAAPDFTLPSDGGGQVALADFKGAKLVLYFYPKDNTPGCTKEACSFSEALPAFEGLGVCVVGVSKCSAAKHDNFKAKHGLKIKLASDAESDVCKRYGVWAEKSMYGKKYMGIERATFLIDEQGKIEHIWRKVKVAGHVEDVQSVLQS